MKNLFLTGTKLLGIYFFYRSLFQILGQAPAMLLANNPSATIPGMMPYLAVSLSITIIQLCLSLALLFKTELILKWTGLSDGEDINVAPRVLVEVGGVLTGITIAVIKIGPLLKDCAFMFLQKYRPLEHKVPTNISSDVLTLLAAFLLIIWAHKLPKLVKS